MKIAVIKITTGSPELVSDSRGVSTRLVSNNFILEGKEEETLSRGMRVSVFMDDAQCPGNTGQ